MLKKSQSILPSDINKSNLLGKVCSLKKFKPKLSNFTHFNKVFQPVEGGGGSIKQWWWCMDAVSIFNHGIFIHFGWKRNFPMTPHVRPLVGCSVGLSVIISKRTGLYTSMLLSQLCSRTCFIQKCPSQTAPWHCSRSAECRLKVRRSIIISLQGGKFQFHAPIGALVVYFGSKHVNQ